MFETHSLRSRHVAQTFKIDVMLPARAPGETTRFPVVYATDANLTFEVLKGISHGMQLSQRVAPRFILVGIGYPGESPWCGTLLRARDFTFPGFPRFLVDTSATDGVIAPEKGTKDFHGGEAFRQFIETELIPFIDARYATLPCDRTYFGHSLGGAFGLQSMFTRPDLFKRYVLVSPAVSLSRQGETDGEFEADDFGIRAVRALVAAGNTLPEIKAYLSVGSEEEYDSVRSRWQFTSSFYRLTSVLKAASIPGLELTCEVLPGETHMTVWPVAFMHGVRAVFGLTNRP